MGVRVCEYPQCNEACTLTKSKGLYGPILPFKDFMMFLL